MISAGTEKSILKFNANFNVSFTASLFLILGMQTTVYVKKLYAGDVINNPLLSVDTLVQQ